MRGRMGSLHAEAMARREGAGDISRGERGVRRGSGVAAARRESHAERRRRGGNKNKDFGKNGGNCEVRESAARRHPWGIRGIRAIRVRRSHPRRALRLRGSAAPREISGAASAGRTSRPRSGTRRLGAAASPGKSVISGTARRGAAGDCLQEAGDYGTMAGTTTGNRHAQRQSLPHA